MSVLNRINNRREVESKELTIDEYINLCKTDSMAYASPHQRLLSAIGEPEIVDTSKDPRLGRIFQNKKIKTYKSFHGFYGMENTIEQIVSYLKAAGQGLEEANQIMYLLGPVGGGKCHRKGTKISMSDGTLKNIEDVKIGDFVLSTNKELKLIEKEITDTFAIDPKQVVEVITKRGLKIYSANTHKYMTDSGWRTVSELNKNDFIATARKTNFGLKSDTKGIDFIKILAYLLGDGHIPKTGNITFTNFNLKIIEDFKNSIEKLGLKVKDQIDLEGNLDYMRVLEGREISLRNKLDELKLLGSYSDTKFFPNFIFQLNENLLSVFLSRLYGTDGWATVGNRCEIGYCTTSEKMASQLVSLLSKFGISARISSYFPKREDGTYYKKAYTVSIKDKNDILTFTNRIGIYGKEDACRLVLNSISKQSRKKSGSLDRIPKSIIRNITENISASKKDGSSKLKDQLRTTIDNNKGCRKEFVIEASEKLNSKELYDIATSDIYWDEIKEINYLKIEEEMYDFEVSDFHNYIANGIISHNSSLAERIKLLMEQSTFYAIKGCPVNESPLNLFDPDLDGDFFEEEYGISRRYLRFPLCPYCLKRLETTKNEDTEELFTVEDFRVVKLKPNRLNQLAIAKTEPADESTQDISTLVGKTDMSQLGEFSRADPRAYSFSGGLNKANRGVLDFVEMFKAPIKTLNPLLTATQEGNYNSSEGFSAIPWDGIIVAHCLSDDTEILTEDGWRGVDDIELGDRIATYNSEDKTLNYHPAINKFEYYDVPEIYEFKSSCMDHLVTGEHKMVYYDYKKEFRKELAKDIKSNDQKNFVVSCDYERPKYEKYTDKEIKFLTWCITDGSLRDNLTTYRFHFKKERKIERLSNLLNELRFEWKSSKSSVDDTTNIYVYNIDSSKFPKTLLQEHRKFNSQQTKIMLEEWAHTDGSIRNTINHSFQIFTNDNSNADIIQELATISGIKTTCVKAKKNGYKDVNMLWVKFDTTQVRSDHPSNGIVEYNGRVWCVEVKNHTIFTRRNGKIVLTGNSNQNEWDAFRNDSKNEAFLDRTNLIRVPYALVTDDVIEILKKLIRKSELNDKPCAPYTIEMLADFIVMTCLTDPENSDIYTKKKVYNGEVLKDTDPKAKSIIEYRSDAGIDEGMTGMSTRFAFKVLSATFNKDPEEVSANPVYLISVLMNSIIKEKLGDDKEKRYINFIREYLQRNYVKYLEKELHKAYIESYPEYGQNMFDRYFMYADHWTRDEEFRDPDTDMKFNRSTLNEELEKIEKAANIANPKDFRNEIVNYINRYRANNQGEFPKWNSYEKMKEVIEAKIFGKTEDILPVISFGSKKTEEEEQKHQGFVDRMAAKGYTLKTIRILVEYYMRVKKSS